MFNQRVSHWMGYLGFLGCLGFLGFLPQLSFALIFFVFFGFFGFFWESKLNKEKPDERLVENLARAKNICWRIGFGAIFCLMILLNRTSLNFSIKYHCLIAIISLSFGLTQLFIPFLTYRFDKNEES
ncbi:hypothetical protein M2139_002398 [Enterococcus sp. PF1-24]|uniref:DUF3796 domain-containing protein n=1 Tax=unclassified Enterococcus TaxID=2608891 RepID=UPI0024751B7D|nr:MULTISPECIES: DUF3796 domain-containing protein [unclassified Enterococcus]MDH6365396.1 hypothetical protein [Enterococcus sp. PFB1-1]MDH6402497.1 hypothetical protein [Enterococcus sp. PF1-24]